MTRPSRFDGAGVKEERGRKMTDAERQDILRTAASTAEDLSSELDEAYDKADEGDHEASILSLDSALCSLDDLIQMRAALGHILD